MSWDFDVYLRRQCSILFSDYLHCIGIGFMLSMPSVLNTALLTPNSDLQATPDEASWIAASHGITGVVGFLVVPAFMQGFGRKAAHYAINVFVVTGFAIFYFATNITHLYIARLIQGLALSGIYVTSIILAEYSDPKRRGYFISFKKSAVIIGSLSCHFLIVYTTWRQIALIGGVSNILAIFLTTPWPESPAYLAMKGRFEDCDKSHTWLFGKSLKSRKDLEKLISAQMELQREKPEGYVIKRIWKKVARKDFLKPFLITTLLTLVIESSGRYYNLAYIVQIMSDIVQDKSIAVYCSLGNDVLILVSLCCSCFVITHFKRRTILFYFGFASVGFMFLISLSLFLKHNNYVAGHLFWLPPGLILVNSFITNLSIVPIGFTISGEIFPLEHRGIGTCVTGITFTCIYTIVLKSTPVMISTTGVHGMYSIYGVCLLVFLIILNIFLNETKDKTLQEIEDEIKGIQRDLTDKEMFVVKHVEVES